MAVSMCVSRRLEFQSGLAFPHTQSLIRQTISRVFRESHRVRVAFELSRYRVLARPKPTLSKFEQEFRCSHEGNGERARRARTSTSKGGTRSCSRDNACERAKESLSFIGLVTQTGVFPSSRTRRKLFRGRALYSLGNVKGFATGPFFSQGTAAKGRARERERERRAARARSTVSTCASWTRGGRNSRPLGALKLLA